MMKEGRERGGLTIIKVVFESQESPAQPSIEEREAISAVMVSSRAGYCVKSSPL